eukprot:CAMPEP_0182423670 /NCGR_PEP_ID=MMETSP1167-20130531/9744_1 /TAXON_ID=2988 /ORGANISM="Mallomonas Sp, Strain CCMP3275" /LENGTH=102 /DNA_ID=CAMNT_0024602857 /DNA_START=36 /DNA_END=341 /DNA_ORIENTATION=-
MKGEAELAHNVVSESVQCPSIGEEMVIGNEETKRVEQAFKKAKDLFVIWKNIDENDDRSVVRSELLKILSPADADMFISETDADGDKSLSFIEFAWQAASVW